MTKMTDFTVRVLLHDDATWLQYETLHQLMAQHGLVRTIMGDSGREYRLPQAEYNLSNVALTAEQVRDAVVSIAASVSHDPDVLVTEAGDRAWRLRAA